jgi:hypothetical protein
MEGIEESKATMHRRTPRRWSEMADCVETT